MPPQILRVLESLVQADHAPPRLSGNVIVAVKSEHAAWIWHAAFAGDRLLGSGYLDGVPRDADAILLFDEAQAAAVAEGRKPKGSVKTYGRHELLEGFVHRYCTFRSFVDVRSSR